MGVGFEDWILNIPSNPMEKTTTKTAAACCGDGEDLMIEILVRLPVVSLLRFKCVCKSWRHLIQTSFFINLHTKQHQDTFILQAQQYEPSYDLMLYEILMLSSESGCGSEYGTDRYWDIDGSLHKLYKLELPSCGISSKLSCGEVMAGSCNGLICLVSEKDRYQCMAVSLWLWNPATRQFRNLPKSLSTTNVSYFSVYGISTRGGSFHLVAFGFDVKTKDYKVVQITYLRHTTTSVGVSTDHYSCQVQVYSLSTDSWRLLEGINSLPSGIPNINDWLYHHHGLYLNGSYFFVAYARKWLSSSNDDNHHCFIISFDFTKEIFNTIQFPRPDHHHHHHVVLENKRWYLSCLGDKLALFTIRDYIYANDNYEYDDYGYEDCDLWVLNENGGGSGVIKESWTKLHSFQIKRREAREWIVPRGILNNGEFALLETKNTDETKRKMQLYNLVTKEAKTDFPICEQEVGTVLVYKPSLVSITGGRKWHRQR